MNCYFYRFPKRINSTKIPDANAGTNIPVQLKEETSILNPVITTIRSDARLFNYAFIPSFTRYYFVSDWVYQNGRWEATLNLDVMGSYRAYIGVMSCYVERSATGYDGNVIDTLYPAKTNFNNRIVSLATSWAGVAPSGGCYVVGVLNGADASRIGASTYYALTPTVFRQFVSALMSDAFITNFGISDISQGLVKMLFKPLEYITSCMWFPFSTGSMGNSSGNIKLGYWDSGVSGVIVSALAQKTFVTATIPNHPQISRGNYLNFAPYTRLTLYIPPFGAIPVDTSYLSAGRHLEAPVYIDHITGKADIFINFNSGRIAEELTSICASRSAQFAVPISLGMVIQDVIGAGAHAVGAVASGISGHITGMIAGAMSAIESLLPQESGAGCNGSFIQSIEDYVAVLQCINLADEDLTELGRPTYSTKTINTLSGYIKCAEAHPAIDSAFDSELQKIESYMTGGFFWE